MVFWLPGKWVSHLNHLNISPSLELLIFSFFPFWGSDRSLQILRWQKNRDVFFGGSVSGWHHASFIWANFASIIYGVLLRGVSCKGWPTSRFVAMQFAQIYGQKKNFGDAICFERVKEVTIPNYCGRKKSQTTEWDKLPTSTGFPDSWTINGMILCVDCFKPLVPSRLLWENVDVAIPDTHPWDWYIYLHEWLVFMVKCREIYQSNGLFGIFFWFRFANHNPHTRPNVSMLCTMTQWAMEAQLDHRFSNSTVY